MAVSRSELRRLFRDLSPQVREAFEEAVETSNRRINRTELIAAIRRNDVEGAIRALNISRDAMDSLREAIRTAVRDGGWLEASSVPKTALQAFFAMGNPSAERVAALRSSMLITEIANSARQAARERISQSIARGENPYTTARSITGVVDRRTGIRTGGVIGLRTQDIVALRNAERELRSGSARYFRRTLRDKRYDQTILKAFRDKRPLSSDYISRVLLRYQAKLLRYRGELIAQTETLASLNGGRYEYLRQLVESGEVLPREITLTWHDMLDTRVRDTHLLMGKAPRNKVIFGQPFVFPGGGQALYPGDISLGAPANEIINCRCYFVSKVDWIAVRRRERRMEAA